MNIIKPGCHSRAPKVVQRVLKMCKPNAGSIAFSSELEKNEKSRVTRTKTVITQAVAVIFITTAYRRSEMKMKKKEIVNRLNCLVVLFTSFCVCLHTLYTCVFDV